LYMFLCLKILFFLIFNLFCKVNSQEIPIEFLEYSNYKFNISNGESWDNYTLFGPPRYQRIKGFKKNKKDDLLNIKSRYGLLSSNNDFSLYGFGHFSYQK
mgnify:CR=1